MGFVIVLFPTKEKWKQYILTLIRADYVFTLMELLAYTTVMKDFKNIITAKLTKSKKGGDICSAPAITSFTALKLAYLGGQLKTWQNIRLKTCLAWAKSFNRLYVRSSPAKLHRPQLYPLISGQRYLWFPNHYIIVLYIRIAFTIYRGHGLNIIVYIGRKTRHLKGKIKAEKLIQIWDRHYTLHIHGH